MAKIHRARPGAEKPKGTKQAGSTKAKTVANTSGKAHAPKPLKPLKKVVEPKPVAKPAPRPAVSAPSLEPRPQAVEAAKGVGARGMHVRVKKKAGTIKESSRRWLERHMNDPYVHRSRAEGLRSRAAFKLTEINERYNIIKKGDRIIDLGAAPGGWSQISAKIIDSQDERPHVVGIDFLEIAPLPGVTLLLMDFLDEAAPQAVLDALGGPPDVVLSDMAAPTTGHRRTDHMRTMHLCEVAAQFAIDNLKTGGHFLSKTFQGGTENDLLDLLKRNFKSVHHVKPPASRQESVELYILAKGFKGREPTVEDRQISPVD